MIDNFSSAMASAFSMSFQYAVTANKFTNLIQFDYRSNIANQLVAPASSSVEHFLTSPAEVYVINYL